MIQSKLISIYAPATYCTIDVYIDSMVKLDEMRFALASLMEKATHGRFLAHSEVVLLRKKDGTCLFGEQNIEQIGIKNSEEFYLL